MAIHFGGSGLAYSLYAFVCFEWTLIDQKTYTGLNVLSSIVLFMCVPKSRVHCLPFSSVARIAKRFKSIAVDDRTQRNWLFESFVMIYFHSDEWTAIQSIKQKKITGNKETCKADRRLHNRTAFKFNNWSMYSFVVCAIHLRLLWLLRTAAAHAQSEWDRGDAIICLIFGCAFNFTYRIHLAVSAVWFFNFLLSASDQLQQQNQQRTRFNWFESELAGIESSNAVNKII